MVWVSIALSFNLGILFFWHAIDSHGDLSNGQAALTFLTSYLIEYALSVDNIFIFIIIFSYFAVPARYQHRVLFYGILGALVMRGTLITVGSALVGHFHWILYIFGVFLIYTSIQLFRSKDEELEPEKNPVLRFARHFFPITEDYNGERFFIRSANILTMTPLFLVLLVVESTDLIFALDSIPAVFAITTHAYIAFTSNILAILGLRSLYFLLASMMKSFHYLQQGLSIILAFIGIKMLTEKFYEIPIFVSLGIIISILALAIAASILWPPLPEKESELST